ncbi:MAG: leader peptidase (prepilin peptidase)/N-methyltransferase [Gammaproteobacteria bacterium]
MIELLQLNPTLFTVVAGIMGLLVGSFLNVVIHRLPLMMEREWRGECESFLSSDSTPDESEPFNLMTPRSRCPSCNHEISALENIPVISYVVLGGKCKACKASISARYPVIEVTSAIVAIAVSLRFGFGAAGISALALSWCLISLAAIDMDTQLLPDAITLPLLWAGIIVNFFGVFVSLKESVLGAILGYLSLWTVFWGFKLATGKDGMGYGDFKLLAVLGAWLGWQVLPIVIIVSSVVGACFGISMMLFAAHDKSKPIPFGPYLAIAGWIALIWGDDITQRYLFGTGSL